MSETEAVAAPASPAKKGAKAKKPAGEKKAAVKKVATHPPCAEMVPEAIKKLNEKGGSSLIAIKKYLASNYNVDTTKKSFIIKKYLRAALEKGQLVQGKKSKGMTGSFQLPVKEKKKASPAKKKVAPAKKAASTKKAASPKKKAAAAKPKKAAAKKVAKSPVKAKKPKAKPVAAKKAKASPKKAAAKKPAAKKSPAKKK
jgi:histone H1/5